MNDYYTVAEFAQITGKDPGNIRRMLVYGKLIGEKAGKQWLIPKDAVYPQDKRVKSGEYKNWRKKQQLSHNCPKLMKSLKKMCSQFLALYGNSMSEVILYGSYARGEQSSESDVDIALILKETGSEKEHDKMIDIVVDYELDLALTLSVVPIELGQFQEWKETLPYYKNIDKEGITIWKEA